MIACYHGHKDVVQLLLDNSERNIDFNARNDRGSTALMWACFNGQKDDVQLLLDNSEKKIDLNARNNGGWTALMHARQEGHNDVVQLLLAHFDNIRLFDSLADFWRHQMDI